MRNIITNRYHRQVGNYKWKVSKKALGATSKKHSGCSGVKFKKFRDITAEGELESSTRIVLSANSTSPSLIVRGKHKIAVSVPVIRSNGRNNYKETFEVAYNNIFEHFEKLESTSKINKKIAKVIVDTFKPVVWFKNLFVPRKRLKP